MSIHTNTHSSGSVQSQEALHVSSCHELQQYEARQDLQTDSDTAHNVLMAELTADTKDEEINSNGLLNGRTGLLVKIVPELHNKVILNYVK